MDYNFKDWKKALDDFKGSVSKDLEEIRQHKEEIRQVKAEILNALNDGYYLRDPKRIVLSAPEIILGDVDRDGVLQGTGLGRIVLRGHSVNLEGAGDSGQVCSRAASIVQKAEDPGVDGQEAVVGLLSQIVNQAGEIVLAAHRTQGVFSQAPGLPGGGGVHIHADGVLSVEASQSSEIHKANLEEQLASLDQMKTEAEQAYKANLSAFDQLGKDIASSLEAQEKIMDDVMEVRSQYDSLEEGETDMEQLSSALYQTYDACARSLSRLAEITRQINCLKKEKGQIKGGDEYKKNPTGAAVSIIAEQVGIVSRDGDGNLRDNPDAGLHIVANDIKVEAVDAKGALQQEGKLFVNAKTVEVSTQNAQDLNYNDKNELESAKYTAEGEVVVKSKTFTLEALDQEFKDNKLEEKALTKDSLVSIRAEKMDLSATDTEGKATGSLAMNAKDVSLRSMDVDKEKRTDNKLSEGSSLLILAEKMYLGAKKKDIKSKKVQLSTEEAGLFADKTLELQQGEAKAVLQLSDGKAALSGSETELYGKTTLNGKTEVKDELKAPKATIEHVQAKTSFKSQNISDGIPVPPPPSTAKLSAKLKAEDAPEKK